MYYYISYTTAIHTKKELSTVLIFIARFTNLKLFRQTKFSFWNIIYYMCAYIYHVEKLFDHVSFSPFLRKFSIDEYI